MSKASTTKRPMSGDYDDDYEPMSPQGKSKSPTAASAKSPVGAKSPTASTPQVNLNSTSNSNFGQSISPQRVGQSPMPQRSSSALDGDNKDDTIVKLKQVNANLRLRLKEFSMTLDKSIHSASNGTITLGTSMSTRQLPQASSDDTQVLQSEIRNMHKKLEIYRKANEQLRRQLEASSAAEHLVALENTLAERALQIEQLQTELKLQKKTLARANREGAIDPNAVAEQSEQRLYALMDENRVLKDRVRDLGAKHVADEKAAVLQHERLQAANNQCRVYEEQLKGKDAQVKALQQRIQQQAQAAEVDHSANDLRLAQQVEELQTRVLALTGAKNMAERKAQDAKAALKGAQEAGDEAKKKLAEVQHDYRRLQQVNESYKLKMAHAGMSVTTVITSPTNAELAKTKAESVASSPPPPPQPAQSPEPVDDYVPEEPAAPAN